MFAHSQLFNRQNRSANEAFGPCAPIVQAVTQLAERLNRDARERIGYAAGAYNSTVWLQALQESTRVASACNRTIGCQGSPWLSAFLETQDILTRTVELNESLHPSELGARGEDLIVQLAQATTVWDHWRPKPFVELFAFLARIGYEPPLVGPRAPIIVGIQMVSTCGKGTLDYYSGVALLRLSEAEHNDRVTERLSQVENINAAFTAQQADVQRNVLREVNPP